MAFNQLRGPQSRVVLGDLGDLPLFLPSEPPKRGRKTGAARKLSKSVENIFDDF